MAPSGSPERVSLANFVSETDQTLTRAVDPQTPMDQSVEAAKSVVNRLSAIEAGTLAVHPPLSEAQAAHYRDKSETVIATWH